MRGLLRQRGWLRSAGQEAGLGLADVKKARRKRLIYKIFPYFCHTTIYYLLEENQTTISSELKRSEEHTSELQSRQYLVCRLLLEKKKKKYYLTYNSTIITFVKYVYRSNTCSN